MAHPLCLLLVVMWHALASFKVRPKVDVIGRNNQEFNICHDDHMNKQGHSGIIICLQFSICDYFFFFNMHNLLYISKYSVYRLKKTQ